MHFLKEDSKFIIRFSKGEELIDTLTKFCEAQGIFTGVFKGIGAFQESELGFYELSKKEYHFKQFKSDHEIVSLTGNIAVVDEKPFLHIHTVLSDENFNCVGGHLKEGVVGATCEVYLTVFDSKIDRKLDEEVGLKLLDCSLEFS